MCQNENFAIQYNLVSHQDTLLDVMEPGTESSGS